MRLSKMSIVGILACFAFGARKTMSLQAYFLTTSFFIFNINHDKYS